MRSLWLASAALCLTAGVAMAQTTSSSPAPTGAPNAAAASPAPGAPPGNMAPSNGMGGSGGAMSSGSSGSMGSMGMTSSPPATTSATGGLTAGSSSTAATAPHYTGQNTVSQPTGQAGAPDNAAGTNASPEGTMASSQPASAGMTHTASRAEGSMKLPEDADSGTYLKIASKAIKQHDKMLADDALSHAETRMLTRAVPAASGATVDDSPGVTAIENARQALRSGDYQAASADTRMAMHDRHGMGGGMNGSGMSGDTENGPMGASGAGAMGGPAQ